MQTFAEKNNCDKLLDLKVAPMLLDNKISMCVQFNDVTKQNVINAVL